MPKTLQISDYMQRDPFTLTPIMGLRQAIDGLLDHKLSSAPVVEQGRLLSTVNHLAAALERVTGAEKINIGALGNLVPQLHVHIIARFQNDPCWPGPG